MHSIHCVPLHRHATCKQKQGETKAEQTTATHIQSTRAPPPNHQQWRAWRLFGRCPTGGRVLEVLKKTSCTWRPTARQRTVPSLHPGPDRPLDDFHPNRVANVIRLIMHTGLNQPTVSSSTRARQFRSWNRPRVHNMFIGGTCMACIIYKGLYYYGGDGCHVSRATCEAQVSCRESCRQAALLFVSFYYSPSL